MARIARSIPAAVAALLLAAHFFRGAALVPAALCAASIGLFFVTRPWATHALRLGLAAGTVVWIVTAWRIAQARIDAGMPYQRMLAILGGVAVFTVFAAWILPVSRGTSDPR